MLKRSFAKVDDTPSPPSLHLSFNEEGYSLPTSYLIWSKTHLTSLDLSDANWSIFDMQSMTRLTNLQQLNLYNLELATVPEPIRSLTNLTSLNLNATRIQTIPEWLGNLCHLKTLQMRPRRGVPTIPNSLSRLTALKNLETSSWGTAFDHLQLENIVLHEAGNPSYRHMRKCPEEIFDQTALVSLEINFMSVDPLPKKIAQMTRLKSLCLTSCNIHQLPAEIGDLTSLVNLDIDRNRLISLPPEIGQLNMLEHLTVSENDITTLPASVCQLPNLKDLYFSANPIETLPNDVFSLLKTGKVHHLFHANSLQWYPLWMCQTWISQCPLAEGPQFQRVECDKRTNTATALFKDSTSFLSTLVPDVQGCILEWLQNEPVSVNQRVF